jgi:hypothetical protein
MTDDEKASAVAEAIKVATSAKPTFTGTTAQRKKAWRLAVWHGLAPVVRAERPEGPEALSVASGGSED